MTTDHSSVFDFSAKTIQGQELPLSEYRGRALLIVNVASECGFTPQYEGLEKLYRKFKDRGLVVLGFPCNQFGSQEPGDSDQIQQFCETRFKVTFPMFEKIDVNGADAHPLYRFLKGEKPGLMGTEMIKWNFTKFLVGRDGKVLERFAPNTTPEAIEPKIEALLA